MAGPNSCTYDFLLAMGGGRSCRWAAAISLAVILSLGSSHGARAENKDDRYQRLTQELQDILQSPELEKALAGVHVVSLSAGKEVFSHNAKKLFNPASNMKLLTTAAALWYLGPTYRFRTVVSRDRELQGQTVKGNLYIKGYGDPMLTHEEAFGLVNEVALKGIRKVNGDLIIDVSFFDDVREGPGWEQEIGDHAYAAPVGALSVNFNTYSVHVMPGPGVGAPALVEVWPDVPSIKLNSSIVTRGAGSRGRIWLGTSSRGRYLEVTARGQIAANDHYGRIYRKPVVDPNLHAGEMFKQLLEMRGIEIKGKVKVGLVAPRAIPVAAHWSRTLAEIIGILNKYSNNFMAEQILKTLAAERLKPPGSWAHGQQVLSDFLVELGVSKDAFVLGNGSGLNDINRITPEQITRVLATMYDRFELRPEFLASLAVAGASGTITGRFENSPAVSRLRAKTGSLTGVSALSGYVVSQSQETFAFSIMMNDYPGRARSMWQVQDRIGIALARFSSKDAVASQGPNSP